MRVQRCACGDQQAITGRLCGSLEVSKPKYSKTSSAAATSALALGTIQTDVFPILSKKSVRPEPVEGHSDAVSNCVSQYFVSQCNALPKGRLRANGSIPGSEV
jgi:hypothetical protein